MRVRLDHRGECASIRRECVCMVGAGSHRGKGWKCFTDAVLRAINEKDHRVVFILWGNDARRKKKLITNPLHRVIESAHPSPLSAYRGFFDSRPFSRTNEFLSSLTPIDWSNTRVGEEDMADR